MTGPGAMGATDRPGGPALSQFTLAGATKFQISAPVMGSTIGVSD